jgi:hypothetical protein
MNGVVPPLPLCFHGAKIDNFLFILPVISVDYDNYRLTSALWLQVGLLLDKRASLPLGINHDIHCRNHSDHKTSRPCCVSKSFLSYKTSHARTRKHLHLIVKVHLT